MKNIDEKLLRTINRKLNIEFPLGHFNRTNIFKVFYKFVYELEQGKQCKLRW